MTHIKFEYGTLKPFVADHELDEIQWQVTAADKVLREGTGAGSDFLGWIDLPEDYDKAEFARIQAAAKKIQSDSDVLVVLGIGGSYLGAKAATDFLHSSFQNLLTKEERKNPLVLYAGNSISSN
ncbi:MAG: glucose-6-phosphate isomerase, partial [Streptococcaceae bacterium]|nr:glucose-6-phosphate isomerase [Streptococcaceae bacterium]